MAPIDLYVDMGELARVQQELSTLLSALIDLGGSRPVQADDGSMGSHEVADAVHRFVSNWSDGRARIIESLRACQGHAAKAVEDYSRTETLLALGLTPASLATGGRANGGGGGW